MLQLNVHEQVSSGSSKDITTDKCEFSKEVVADVRAWPSADGEDGLQKKIRKGVQTSARFYTGWPTCHVTGKAIPLSFRRGSNTQTYIGYFRCMACTRA